MTAAPNNSGQGTISYLDVKDVYGSPLGGNTVSWLTATETGANSAFDHITVTNSGAMALVETSGATVGLTINGLAITSSTYTLAGGGCLVIRENSSAAVGLYRLSNAYFDCGVTVDYTGNYSIYTWQNVLMYRSPDGSFPGHYVGIYNGGNVAPIDVFDEYFVYPSIFYLGGTADNIRPFTPAFALINSVLWSPKTSTGGVHVQLFTTNIYYLPGSNSTIRDNVVGAMGVNTNGGTQQLTTSMSTTTSNIQGNLIMKVVNNVSLCDQWGYSSLPVPFTRQEGPGSATNGLTVTVENNTICTAIIGGLKNTTDNAGSEGATGFESTGTLAKVNMTFDSNLYWNNLNLAVPEVCGKDSLNFGPPNQPVSSLTNNAVANTNELPTTPPICNDTNPGNPSTWVKTGPFVTGPQADVILNTPPVFVDASRSPVTFDVDYLIPKGHYGITAYTGATDFNGNPQNYRAAWLAGQTYNPGDIVSDSQTGSWSGKTLYWRCIQGHISATQNRPSTGVDPANIYSDFNQFWELAYMQFFRQQVYLGTDYGMGKPHFDPSLPQLIDINGVAETTHMIGLLNSWIRQGMTTTSPQLTHGCLSGELCGINDGDPHITTANGVHYNFQGAGEYVALRNNTGMEVQTREAPIATTFNPGPDPHDGVATCVSLNTAVAARVGNHRVTYEPNLNGVADPSGLQLRVDGKLTSIGAGALDLGNGARLSQTSVPGGLEIDFPDNNALFVTPSWWQDQAKWYLNVDFRQPPAYGIKAGAVPGAAATDPQFPGGLMAAIPADSWLPLLPDGTSMGPMPASIPQRYLDLYQKFGDAWRVSDKTSLFDYAPGTSTDSFTVRSWPKDPPCTIRGVKPAEPVELKVAERACRQVMSTNAKADCVFDVRVTGNTGFATTYLASQQVLTGRGTTPPPPPPSAGRLAAFLDLGANFPQGTFSGAFKNGFSLNAGLEYMATSRFSVEGIFGYHYAPAKVAGSLNIYQFSVDGKAYLLTGNIRPFINAGIGGYAFSPGSTYFGGNVGGGVLFTITPHWGVQGSYNFHAVSTPVSTTQFSTLQGGIRYVF
ncbi:MAG: outer membrane beta-barrel protein [Candidatus Korobacteraceae bacterium]